MLSELEKWKSAVLNKKVFGTLLTDLSKACDCFSHDLLLAKLNAYGFSMAALKLTQTYLSNRKQRNDMTKQWEDIFFGVPHGFILGLLLFNTFLCNLFSIMNNVESASYVDDITPYAVENNIEKLIVKL